MEGSQRRSPVPIFVPTKLVILKAGLSLTLSKRRISEARKASDVF
jgi:hypothetical protein